MEIENVYCCSDIHGDYSIWSQIKEILDKDETSMLYFLGDAADRGVHGYQIIKEMLNHPRVIYIKGNHEDMFVRAAREFISPEEKEYFFMQMLYQNGGESTFDSWLVDRGDINFNIINQLDKLPYYQVYTNPKGKKILLCHAGVSYALPINRDLTEKEKDDILWDRDHIHQPWSKDAEYDVMIHGHTPVQIYNKSLAFNYPIIDIYCKNHKINIDMGLPESGLIRLLNLNTGTQICLTSKEEK